MEQEIVRRGQANAPRECDARDIRRKALGIGILDLVRHGARRPRCEHVVQQRALTLEKRLRHFGFRHNPIEAVECAGHDLDLAPNTRGLEPLGIGKVLIVKQVEGADTEPLDPYPEMLTSTVVWWLRDTGRRQMWTPIPVPAARRREHGGNFAQRRAGGKFGCLVQFPRRGARRFDLSHPARRQRD